MYQRIVNDFTLPFELEDWDYEKLSNEEKRNYMKVYKPSNDTSPVDPIFQAPITPVFEIQTDPVVSSRSDSFEFGDGSFGGGGASGHWDGGSSSSDSSSYDSGSYDSAGGGD